MLSHMLLNVKSQYIGFNTLNLNKVVKILFFHTILIGVNNYAHIGNFARWQEITTCLWNDTIIFVYH